MKKILIVSVLVLYAALSQAQCDPRYGTAIYPGSGILAVAATTKLTFTFGVGVNTGCNGSSNIAGAPGSITILLSFPNEYYPDNAASVVPSAASNRFTWTWDPVLHVMSGINNTILPTPGNQTIEVTVKGRVATPGTSVALTLLNWTTESIPGVSNSQTANDALQAQLNIDDIVLPVIFSNFTTKESNCGASVKWNTYSEQNVRGYEIEQSYDGINYTKVKTIESKGNGANSYDVFVEQSQKRMYYRVVAVDLDGRRTIGPVTTLQLTSCKGAAVVRVFPIPVAKDQPVTVQVNVDEKVAYRVIDVTGKTVKTGNFVRTTQITEMTSGTYLLEMTGASFKETQTIIVQ